MPVYNGVKNYPPGMLYKAIDTSLRQATDTIHVTPVICVNECMDETEDVLREFYGDIIILGSEYNLGMANGASLAATFAPGDYFIIQSVRSWYEPGSFAKMVEVLENNGNVGFVYGNTQYHGEMTHYHRPGEYRKEHFYQNFKSLFGYMYRRGAWDAGCRYIPFLYADGRWIDMADRDFQMQMIEYLGWDGYWIDEPVLNYYYGGDQMTKRMKNYQRELDAIWKARWPKATGGFGGTKIT